MLVLSYLIFFAVMVVLPPLRHPDASDTYAKKIKQPPRRTGERVINLEDNREALIWRLRLIQSAQKEIWLSTYSFSNDKSGQDVMAALQDAARRGVQVRILVDGMNGTASWYTGAPIRALASQPNVELKLYNPMHLMKPWTFTYRMHDKYLIVDDQAFLLGGRNTNDIFLGDYTETSNHDRDLLVWQPEPEQEGVIEELIAYAKAMWEHPNCERMVRPGKRSDQESQKLEERFKTLPEKYPELQESVDLWQTTVPTESITLWSNPTEVTSKEPQLWYALRNRMMQGNEIWMQTPYIVCSKAQYEDLEELAGGERKMQIMTNSPVNGANPFGCSDYLNNKKKILKTGSELYELHSPISAHTKTVLVDDCWSCVGSYNFDMRSTYLNTELMLEVNSPELNARLKAEYERLENCSNHIKPDGTEQPGKSCPNNKMGVVKWALYSVLRLITLPIRHLL